MDVYVGESGDLAVLKLKAHRTPSERGLLGYEVSLQPYANDSEELIPDEPALFSVPTPTAWDDNEFHWFGSYAGFVTARGDGYWVLLMQLGLGVVENLYLGRVVAGEFQGWREITVRDEMKFSEPLPARNIPDGRFTVGDGQLYLHFPLPYSPDPSFGAAALYRIDPTGETISRVQPATEHVHAAYCESEADCRWLASQDGREVYVIGPQGHPGPVTLPTNRWTAYPCGGTTTTYLLSGNNDYFQIMDIATSAPLSVTPTSISIATRIEPFDGGDPHVPWCGPNRNGSGTVRMIYGIATSNFRSLFAFSVDDQGRRGTPYTWQWVDAVDRDASDNLFLRFASVKGVGTVAVANNWSEVQVEKECPPHVVEGVDACTWLKHTVEVHTLP